MSDYVNESLEKYLETLDDDDIRQMIWLYEIQLKTAESLHYDKVVYVRKKQLNILQTKLKERELYYM